MLRSILMKSQMEMMGMLLETGGKVTLVTEQQGTQVNCVLEFWKVEFAGDETVAEISKQNVEGAAWFLLTAYSKM